MNAPIIFSHYGDSKYLSFVFEIAKKYNPEKEIILLGDSYNKKYQKKGIKHVFSEKYNFGNLISEFNIHYKFIKGNKFGKVNGVAEWTHFNFLKWFILYNYVNENDIQSFWVFDSDVFIMKDLIWFEKLLSDIDYSIHVKRMHVMMGIVNDKETLKQFNYFVLELFQDKSYLEDQMDIMRKNPNWALTMMRFFDEFYKRKKFKVVPLFNNSVDFDEVSIVYNVFDIEGYVVDVNNNPILFYGDGPNIFINSLKKGYIKVPLFNTSWMKEYEKKKIYDITTGKLHTADGLEQIRFTPPLIERFKDMVRKIKN